jgi:DNA-nicking Smr family endonuclease
VLEIDLHGLAPDAALRRLAQGLHAARVRGEGEVLVITGRGWGNAAQKPILRGHVERWLDGQDGQRAGALGHERRNRGGALLVRLRRPG